MPSELFCLGTHDFYFEHHSQHGKRRIAVNVKTRRYPELTAPYAAKFAQYSSDMQRKLERQAGENTQEWWWDWAHAEALVHGVGPVSSEGRSGGWLVLDIWTEQRLDTMIDRFVEEACVHCERDYTEHAKGKCLFEPTSFVTHTGDTVIPNSVLEEIRRVDAYVRAVETSMDTVFLQYQDEMMLLIGQELEEREDVPTSDLQILDG